MAHPRHAVRRPTGLLRLAFVLAASALAVIAVPAPAAAVTARGQLQYLDRGGMVPLKFMFVDIRYHAGGLFDVWNTIGTVKTDQFGNFTFTDARSSGSYSV